MSSRHDVPLLRGTFAIRSPRSVLLLNPFQLPLVFSLFLLAAVFTIWPTALEHAPVGFEEQGLIHHVWHYMLLSGSMLTLWGMFSVDRFRLKAELIGLVVLAGACAMNVAALIFSVDDARDLPGFALALRVALVGGCLVRAYIVAREPTVDLLSEITEPG